MTIPTVLAVKDQLEAAARTVHGEFCVLSWERCSDCRADRDLLARLDPDTQVIVDKAERDATLAVADAARLVRNTHLTREFAKTFMGEWVAMPAEDFYALRREVARLDALRGAAS